MLRREKNILLTVFESLYPEPRSELNFSNNYELLVAVLLSAQCTDKKVNQITPLLFSTFPDCEALSKAKLSTVEKIIRPINYYRTKAKNLIKTAVLLVEKHACSVPGTFEQLINLPGVGRKTANVILSERGLAKTFPVDTHVARVSKRLGLTLHINPDLIEEDLKSEFEPGLWRNLHHYLIFHGRRVCKAARPLCAECRLNKICPSANLVTKM